MARRPFYGSGAGTPIAKMDMQTATAPGRMYANALMNFGNTIANSIEKFRANKEKKELENSTYTALKKAGFDDEIAKAGSKDRSVITSVLDLKKFGQQKKYQDRVGDQADRRIDLEDRKVHEAEIKADIDRTMLDAREKVAKSFMESEGAEGKFGKSYVDLMSKHPAKDSPYFYSQVYEFGNRANPKGGVLDRFAEIYEGNTGDIFSDDAKVRKKALAGFLGADPSMNELSSFVELARSADGDSDMFKFDPETMVKEIPGLPGSFSIQTGPQTSVVRSANTDTKSTADIMNSQYAQALIQQARGGDKQAEEELTQYFFKNFKSQDIEGNPILPEPIQEILNSL
jgi:hypothetical protein